MGRHMLLRTALNFLPDEPYIRLQYRYLTHRKLNIDTPTRYNEKLQWIKLYDRKPIYTDLVDKYKVKGIIAASIGEQYVVPLLAVWNCIDEIDFSVLPNQFVIKTNHDSKGVIVCKDKSKLDETKTRRFFAARLKKNGYNYGREWPYKNIDRKILVEQYLEDESGGLMDYKVLCFNGIPKLIQLHQGRFTDHHSQDFYDTEWRLQPFNQKGEISSISPTVKPPFLSEMLDLSAKLAKNIPHVRVDWYFANGQLYFGEMTFFDSSGYVEFVPDEYNDILGSWIELPERKFVE